MIVADSSSKASVRAVSFQTQLGWMAIQVKYDSVQRIWFGYETQLAVETAAETSGCNAIFNSNSEHKDFSKWVHPLQDFAAGEKVSFSRWKIDTSHLTPFKKSVVQCCRKIPRGKTVSYGELAELAGSPRAARAVGTVMSSNQLPIVVPCHRVVAAGGSLGGYSSPRGLDMKRRLLLMEGALDI